jgi:hypothetical protein
MKTNFYPNRQFYTNDAEQDYWSGVRLKEKEIEERELYKQVKELKETAYSAIANKVNLDVEAFNDIKRNLHNYGLMINEILAIMKSRGFTQQEFDEIIEKYNALNLKYIFANL